MKKLSLVLALVTVLTLCVCSLGISVSAAKPIDAFTEVEVPAQEDKIISTTWNYYVGVRQLENPVGAWSWANTFDGKDSCWGMNYNTNFLDCDQKTIILEFKDEDLAGANGIGEFVFADTFTQSGLGNQGRIRATMEDVFDEMTVVYSDDGENWTKVGFSVAYHTEEGTFNDDTPVDTYWHLIFDEPVPPVHFLAIHTSEARAWDADDHAPKLGICLGHIFTYAIKADYQGGVTEETEETEEPVETTEAPVTEPETTEAPATDPVTTEAPGTAETDDTKADAENDMTWLYIVIAAAAVIAIVVVVVVAKKKK